MTAITYTAKRSIITGHTSGTDYQLECEMSILNPYDKFNKSENFSQGGQSETILHNIENGYNFTSSFIENADRAQWIEFVHSVASNESFIFDAFGTIATVDNEENVELVGSPSWTRVGNQNLWQIAFKMRVI